MKTQHQSTVAVILAGGQSQRMQGANKALLSLNGKSLIQNTVDRLTGQADHILISAPKGSAAFPRGYEVVSDPVEGFVGPLAGILAAMRWAQTEGAGDLVLSVAVDTPFFPDELLTRFLTLLPEQGTRPVIARTDNGLHPTFGLWPVSSADALETFLLAGNRKMRLWAEQQHCVYCDFAPLPIGSHMIDPFFNINHPDDLKHAETIRSA